MQYPTGNIMSYFDVSIDKTLILSRLRKSEFNQQNYWKQIFTNSLFETFAALYLKKRIKVKVIAKFFMNIVRVYLMLYMGLWWFFWRLQEKKRG